MKTYEIRDPIHGFIQFNEWERDIINHAVFQRLRRIRQLGWTEMVYPGATHTRFEHSLGVMHVATRMLRQIAENGEVILRERAYLTPEARKRVEILVRLAALLHDIGHSPFSHAGEDLMPQNPRTGHLYRHEEYSAALVLGPLRDLIEGHKMNHFEITPTQVAGLITGSPEAGKAIFWRDLISGQLDADRADYLLRDAYHAGVNYGRYDLDRLIVTLTVTEEPEAGEPVIAVKDDGRHAAEALIIARYMMFTQVYFHKVRQAYDHHITNALRECLVAAQQGAGLAEGGRLPPPDDSEHLAQYLEWDDWKVLGLISERRAGEHGEILRNRLHYRRVHETPEVAGEADLDAFQRLADAVGHLRRFTADASKSWYQPGAEDIHIECEQQDGKVAAVPLSTLSSVVGALRPISQRRIYVHPDDRAAAQEIRDTFLRRQGERAQ